MSIKLITVDMNSTFLSDAKICDRLCFLAQYRQVREQNTRSAVASGNQYYQLISLFPGVVHQIAFVAEDGGWVVSGNESVFNRQLSPHHLNAVVDHPQTLPNVEIIACGKRSAYTLNCYNDTLKTVAAEYYHRLELVDDSNHPDDAALKFGLNVPDNLIPEIQPKSHAALGDIVTTVATDYSSIGLIIPGVYKTNDLCISQQHWGIEDHEVVAFGNSGNDIEVLQRARFGFAMASAQEDVKTVASHHTSYNSEEGAPQVIDKVLSCEASFA